MQKASILSKWDEIRFSFFEWRKSTTLVKKLGLALIWACVTGILAQVKIPLPWTPVPITGHTFSVMLAGCYTWYILGWNRSDSLCSNWTSWNSMVSGNESLQLAFWIKIAKGNFPTLINLLMMGFIPFIIGDLIKISIASLIGKIITPKKDFISKK